MKICQKKRARPSWDESFMFSALWFATRSSCLHLQTGAVIVKDKRIIASGYNGAPPGIENCLERGCRKEKYCIGFKNKGKAVCRGSHAEISAINQIARQNLKDASLYSLYFPCSSCAKAIVGSEFKEVVYAKIYDENDALTHELFAEANIQLRKFELELELDKYFRMIKDVL